MFMTNYADMYEILRKEKFSETLQLLPKGFVEEVALYFSDRKNQEGSDGDLFQDSIIKAKKQLENSISIFRELLLRRKKKILNLVFIAAETGIMKRDYENMLPAEREIFDKFVKAFEEGDKQINKLLSGKKEAEEKFRLVMFNQDVEEFVDHGGKVIGPYTAGELANIDKSVADILVSGGKAGFVEENV